MDITRQYQERQEAKQLPWIVSSFTGKGFNFSFIDLARHVIIQGLRNIYIAISAYCVNIQAMNITGEILSEGIRILPQQLLGFQARYRKEIGKLLELVSFLR